MEHSDLVQRIKLLATDVDGVLTDGSITYSSDHAEIKTFNIKDGLAIKLASLNDLPVVWITHRSSEAVLRRANELSAHVFQGQSDKEAGLRMVAEQWKVSLDEIAYVGDDLNDIPALGNAGLPIAVADAAPEILELAKYVTKATGGHGAIREVIELILRGQERWEDATRVYIEHLKRPAPRLNPHLQTKE